MKDQEIREFESSLWTGDADNYREKMDGENVIVAVPEEPFLMSGQKAIEAMADTPRWDSIDLQDMLVSRPEHGLIAIGYKAVASRDGEEEYHAYCTSTYRRLDDEKWRVIQHSQTLVPQA